MISDLLGIDKLRQAKEVNARVNRLVRYREDLSDQWQTPQETLALKSGDCEDYAILKFALLRKLNWPKGAVRMAYCQQTTRGVARTAHMVLEIFDGHAWYVLDNMGQSINPWSNRPDLTKMFAFDVDSLWTQDKLTGQSSQDRLGKWKQVIGKSAKQEFPIK